MRWINMLLFLVALAVTTPAEAGLASIPVGTAGYHVEGTVGSNTVAGDATYDATTKVMSYFGRVAEPGGERWVALTAHVTGWKTVDGATWLFDDVKATVYVGGVAYAADLRSVGGEVVADGFQAGLVDLVTVYARGTSARFTSSGGIFPAIRGADAGPVAFSFTNARGERFDGQFQIDNLQTGPAFGSIQGAWTTSSGHVGVIATFVEDRTFDDEFHIEVDGFHIEVDGVTVARAFPDAFRVRAPSVDELATKLVRLVLVTSQSAM